MKKRTLLYINLFLSLLILSGFFTILATNYNTHRILMEDAIENITKLTSSTIYEQINDELTKPLYVSQTMANDSFLHTWLEGEEDHKTDSEYLKAVENYLLTLKNKYNYDTAYTISARTNTYYYYDGVNKVVGLNSKHDQWYYRFLESGENYVLNIDEDEVNHGEPTVFIDSRMQDENGNFMGVTGVGVKLSEMQEMLKEFEAEYGLEAYLIRADGSISVHTNDSRINKVNLFDERAEDKLKDIVTASRDDFQMTWLSEGALRNCVISRYIENLDWYLVVEKDTSDLYTSFQNMFLQDLLIAGVVLMFLLILSTLGVKTHQQIQYAYSRLDDLTGLHDRQYFMEKFKKNERRWLNSKATFFLLDVDHFKSVNDTHGHLMGNTVLSTIGRLIRDEVASHGLAIRWGGDEFAGILTISAEEAIAILENIRKKLTEIDFGITTEVSISAGITLIQQGDTPEKLLERADQALYASKENGRNRISVYEK